MCDHPIENVQFLRINKSRQFCARCSACELVLGIEAARGSIVFSNRASADHKLLVMADYNAYIRSGAH